MAYNGFHTQQERDDYMTTQINNPNRVGSGFINLGPQQRFAQPTAAANWQTNSLVGGAAPGAGRGAAPQQVADIWNPAPPKPPMAAAPAFAQPPPQQFAQQDQTVNQLFNSVGGVDFNAGAPRGRQPAPPRANNQMMQPPGNLAGAPNGQPFMNGGGGGGRRGGPPPPQASPPGGANLMSMLHNAPPQAAPAVASQPAGGFAGNGVAPQRGSQPFSQNPPSGNNYNGGGGRNASNRGAPPAAPPAPPPQKKPQSITDYAAAAQSYRPPTAKGASTSAQSITRQAESEAGASVPGSGGGRTAPSEWQCSRCTFLNHASLAECEMCGFSKPGKPGPAASNASSARGAAPKPAAAAAAEDGGWQTATKKQQPSVGGGGGGQAAAAASSKSAKKNEKRRAKKRDGSD